MMMSNIQKAKPADNYHEAQFIFDFFISIFPGRSDLQKSGLTNPGVFSPRQGEGASVFAEDSRGSILIFLGKKKLEVNTAALEVVVNTGAPNQAEGRKGGKLASWRNLSGCGPVIAQIAKGPPPTGGSRPGGGGVGGNIMRTNCENCISPEGAF